jgi:hypothetical protein
MPRRLWPVSTVLGFPGAFCENLQTGVCRGPIFTGQTVADLSITSWEEVCCEYCAVAAAFVILPTYCTYLRPLVVSNWLGSSSKTLKHAYFSHFLHERYQYQYVLTEILSWSVTPPGTCFFRSLFFAKPKVFPSKKFYASKNLPNLFDGVCLPCLFTPSNSTSR